MVRKENDMDLKQLCSTGWELKPVIETMKWVAVVGKHGDDELGH